MMNRTRIREKLGHVFVNQQAEVLSEVIYDSYNALVRADDFNELKGTSRSWRRRNSALNSA